MHELNGNLFPEECVEGAAQQILWIPELSTFSLYLKFALEYYVMKAWEN
jgi:hypothetical protein